MIERAALFLWHLLIGWGGLILGSVYGAIRGFEELLKSTDSLLYRFRDYEVFEIIDRPLTLPSLGRLAEIDSTETGRKPTQVGHFPTRIGEELSRTESSVLKSLKRLKRSDKAVETQWGWYSTKTAPKIVR